MPPRTPDPRRDPPAARRNPPRGGRPDDDGPAPARSGRGGIFEAQAYTPRGRSVREQARTRTPRATPEAPAEPPTLRVVDGGRADEPRTTTRPPAARTAAPSDRTGGAAGRTGGAAGRAGGAAGRTAGAAARTGTAAGGRPAKATGRGAGTAAGGRTGAAGRGTTGAGRAGSAGGPAKKATRTTTGRTGGPAKGGATAPRPPLRRKPRARPKLADPNRRLRLGAFLALAMFACIGIRLVTLQIMPTPAYADGGIEDRLRSVTLFASRGGIYDRSGVPLTHSVEARYIYADPEMVKNPAEAATKLSPLLGVARSDLEKRMAKRKLPTGVWSNFSWLARGVPIEQAQQVMALNIAGIGIGRDERREIPGADLAANLIGFTGEDMTGLEGLEMRYDDVLRGTNGKHRFEAGNGNLDTPIPGGYNEVVPAKPGSSLTLTIDRDLQYEIQRSLSENIRARKGTVGAAVVLDVKTGEVLAQASQPTYNAADWEGFKATDREDAATSFVVDPGSVHKAIIFGAGLEEGVITPKTVWRIPSTIRKADVTYADTHPANNAKMSMAGALAYSSNVTTIKIADQLGAQKVYDYQLKFGLGKPTGEGMPGEASGRVLPPDEWNGSSPGSIPIGHSVDVTPLQMAAVYAAIANDGAWIQPHLIKETVTGDGRHVAPTAPETRQVLSPKHAAELRTLMEAVTTIPDATGVSGRIKGYRVAGKTGTGKRVVDGQYAPGDVASFIGMAPAEAPRYVVAVFAYTPGGGGGDVAGPAFREMMQYTLQHYRVPPSTKAAPKYTAFP
ncbi:penicillin-binding transpeptidase domain-containing protein [Asanoa sp. WMMD1127]|uniref:peptidoglycan D,D-transpeptidase FtsI family protein n=1 Tax=Asanoa sp. WMMD1127 TaxID=3016107 RepID=UPI00241695E6|nr:penicillin-binding transpeptidase domain-containing protein [Asanoa sp. WMMD1127]MDG4827079.1 penicillin-binding transpeptidase domain-containing protein [Asanoa sp. WMMD1127]